MSDKKKMILGQDKNYTGKIPTKVLDQAIDKLKKRHQEHYDREMEIVGFEINGGTGLTKTGEESMKRFKEWADERNMQVEYNPNEILDIIRRNLRYEVDKKNMLKKK